MRAKRTDKSRLGEWWGTLDQPLLTGLLLLMLIGLLVSLAAGPTVAVKKGLEPYYFVQRHAMFAIAGAAVMGLVSFLGPAGVRRLALVVFVAGLALMMLAAFYGPEINGSRRWVRFAGYSLQPSEFVKPSFVVLVAWLLAEKQKRPEFPLLAVSVLLYVVTAGLLISQPDFGQTLLLTLIWGTLFFVAGMPLTWLGAMAGAALALTVAAFNIFSHVHKRLMAFWNPAAGDTYQMDRARDSFIEGGWFGRGPGEGTIKSSLPDAHTDFVFSVIAEEYGTIACMVLLSLIGFVVARALLDIWHDRNGFARNASAGLIALFAYQALINTGVNVGLLPAKGMTLPFISYGGSSLLGMALAMGMLLALTRRQRPFGRKKTTFLGSEEHFGSTR